MAMNTLSSLPQFGIVEDFSTLISTKFEGTVNALCWKRNLEGDFEEIVSKLQLKDNITEVSIEDLLALNLSEKGKTARKTILEDMQLLSDFGASPSLNLLKKYDRDDEFDFISTDVYSYHVDHSPIATDTFLCTYFGAASDFIANEDAIKKIDIPAIREKLKELHQGSDQYFETFLTENYFDLHYEAKPSAKPINLGNGNLWRLAVDHPEQKTLPCIHHAPVENKDEYRLLLIC